MVAYEGILSPQEPTFLNVSIMDNLKTAKPDADDGAVNAAINAVGLRRYISETKDGFDAIIEKTEATWRWAFDAGWRLRALITMAT